MKRVSRTVLAVIGLLGIYSCSTDPLDAIEDETDAYMDSDSFSDSDKDGDGTPDIDDGCPLDPNKTEAGQCGCGVAEGTCEENCADTPDYVDAKGYPCSDWIGFSCEEAVEGWGYTAPQEADLISNCPESCGLCTIDDDPNNDGSPNIGGYNVYYGMLHSHTGISDGSGTPDQAYQYARDTAKLDFFSIADHDYYPNDMTAGDWSTIRSAANSYNQDGTFVTFWGFEWTSDSTEDQKDGLAQGHITIINSDDYCISSYEPTRTLNQLVAWLSTRDAIAFFNHPGQYGTNFNNFNFNFSDKIVGMELWNRSSDYYSSGHYDIALKKGFYMGASGSQDNHSKDWGTMNEWRLAVLSNEKTRSAIYTAMKARRFYSSRDKNLALSFKCNDAEMGSKIASGTLNCRIQATDGNNETFSRIDLLKNGSVIETWNPNSAKPVVDHSVTGNNGDYFYVRVYQSSKWDAISSPIFIDN